VPNSKERLGEAKGFCGLAVVMVGEKNITTEQANLLSWL